MNEEFFQRRLAAMRALEQRVNAIVRLVEWAALITMFVVFTVLHIEGELTSESLGVTGGACIAMGLVVSRAVGSLVRQHYVDRIEREFPLWDGEGRRVGFGERP